jgi:cell wall-associated NlpC family hydrolase
MKGLLPMKLAKKLVVTLLLIVTIASMLPLTAAANGTIAWGAADVSGSSVRIRSGPGLDHSILTNVSRGEVVVVIERTNSEWHKVNYHGTIGYMNVPFLDRIREAANFNMSGEITGSVVNMRARPNTTSSVLVSHREGTVMNIIGINHGWYKVEHGGHTGYVRSDLMSIVPRTEATSTTLASTRATSTGSAPDSNRALGQRIADYAVSYVGHNYVWGGSSPSTGFDCSGFVTYIMRQFGISVTRNASGQYRDNGTHINRSDMVPGDLVFFSNNGHSVTHVGIYIGDGRFVHASTYSTGVIITSITRPNRVDQFFGAKRLV